MQDPQRPGADADREDAHQPGPDLRWRLREHDCALHRGETGNTETADREDQQGGGVTGDQREGQNAADEED